MYSEPCVSPGLGQLPATGYLVGGGSSHPCADYMYKLMNREACARMGYNGTPTPAEQKGTVYAPPPPTQAVPPTIVYPPPPSEPAPLAPIVQTFDVPDYAAPSVGGGAGGGSTTVYELVPGQPGTLFDSPADLSIDVDAPRGFGLVEAAIAAGLAFLLARSYQ